VLQGTAAGAAVTAPAALGLGALEATGPRPGAEEGMVDVLAVAAGIVAAG
jgi:hypothetical protein